MSTSLKSARAHRSSTASVPHPRSFDDNTKLMIDTLKKQVFEDGSKKNIAQTVVDALQVRQATAQALLSRAESSASSAELNFHAGSVVAQTVLNGYGHALAAQRRAEEIRAEMRRLYMQAYETAVESVEAVQKLEDFVKGVASYKAKNDYFSQGVADSMPHVMETGKTALAATLAALQSSMVALASAEEAVASAGGVVREARNLLSHLLPQAVSPDTDTSVPVTSLRQFKFYHYSPSHLSHFVRDLDKTATKGLLFLLDVIRQLREFTRSEMSSLSGEVSMELNAARHVLEKASRVYDNAQASMNAANAAL